MYAVIFEVYLNKDEQDEYLQIAADLRRFLEGREGFISIERFQSLTEEGKLLSLSFWDDEESIKAWRNVMEHRTAQQKGRESIFDAYRIRVAQVVRDYGLDSRDQVPDDSREIHGG